MLRLTMLFLLGMTLECFAWLQHVVRPCERRAERRHNASPDKAKQRQRKNPAQCREHKVSGTNLRLDKILGQECVDAHSATSQARVITFATGLQRMRSHKNVSSRQLL